MLLSQKATCSVGDDRVGATTGGVGTQSTERPPSHICEPEDHIHAFCIGLEDMTPHCNIWCWMFRRTLIGNTSGWYWSLEPNNIHTFEFNSRGVTQTLYLTPVRQGDSLWDYMILFSTAAQRVDNLQDPPFLHNGPVIGLQKNLSWSHSPGRQGRR